MNTIIKNTLLSVSLCATLFAAPSGDARKEILTTYANIAYENYSDALNDAKALQEAIKAFSANPTEATLQKAKEAWLASRESYGTTEAFRLSKGPIDAEEGWVNKSYGSLEGQINPWPLDENMIDYTLS